MLVTYRNTTDTREIGELFSIEATTTLLGKVVVSTSALVLATTFGLACAEKLRACVTCSIQCYKDSEPKTIGEKATARFPIPIAALFLW